MARGNRSPRLGDAPFHLGKWRVDPPLSRISRGEITAHLELRAMDVLVCLAEHAKELVTRHQLMDEVWGKDAISDNTLTRVIADLRGAFNDDARSPSYIETIHRKGYRLLKTPRPVESRRTHTWSARDRIWSTPPDSIQH